MKKFDYPYYLCDKCKNFGTPKCPNSSLCLALDNKPYFESKKPKTIKEWIKYLLEG